MSNTDIFKINFVTVGRVLSQNRKKWEKKLYEKFTTLSLLFSFQFRSVKTSTRTKQVFIGEMAFSNHKHCQFLNLKKQNSSMGSVFSNGFKS